MNKKQRYTVVRGPLAIGGRMVPEGPVDLYPKQAAAHLRSGALVGGEVKATTTKSKSKSGAKD